MAKIRILVVDDHPVLAEGLCALLSSQGDMQVVGQARNGEQAIAQAASLNPDVVVMDVAMPGMNGIEATRAIRREHPGTRVLILTQHEDREYVLPLLAAGASGIVFKRAVVTDLIAGLRVVAQGEAFIHPAVATVIVERLSDPDGPGEPGAERLTARERQVLERIVMGRTNVQIAVELSISAKTVEFHRSNLMSKLGVHSVADLVRIALKRGLVAGDTQVNTQV